MNWILAIVAAAALAGTATFSYQAGQNDIQTQWDADRLVQAAAARKAEGENRATENRQATTVVKAVDDSKTRETAIRSDQSGIRAERDRLRDDLAASRRELSQATADAVRQRAAALDDVFQQCGAAIESLAGAADRHASDSLMYQQAWPK
jgi:hypothetical protein